MDVCVKASFIFIISLFFSLTSFAGGSGKSLKPSAQAIADGIQREVEKAYDRFQGSKETIDLGNIDSSGLSRGLTKILIPKNINVQENAKVPMVIVLHGYSGYGKFYAWYLDLLNEAAKKKFILVLPEGKLEKKPYFESKKRNQFWAANDYCCDFREDSEKEENPLDDVAHLQAVTQYVLSKYKVIDRKRVYLYGHSNGAMMAHRMACEKGEMFAAIATFAGTMVRDHSKCQDRSGVSVLQIHGTADETVKYDGGTDPDHPGAEESISMWRYLNGCGPLKEGRKRNLIKTLGTPANETQTFSSNSCRQGTRVSMWRINNGSHTPPFLQDDFSDQILKWLFKTVKR